MKITPASPENFHHYNRDYKFRARGLRRRMTKGEKKLWQMIRKRSIYGYTFTRQRPVLWYIADFMCKELLLVLESDGLSHESDEQQAKDQKRDNDLSNIGFTTLRFKEWEILASPDEVFLEIKSWVENRMRSLGIDFDSTSRTP